MKKSRLALSGPYDLALSLKAAASFSPDPLALQSVLLKPVRIDGEPAIIEVRQVAARPAVLEIWAEGAKVTAGVKEAVKSMLFADLDLRPFYESVSADSVLGPVTRGLHGLKPMRPASLFEMAVIAITEQQYFLRNTGADEMAEIQFEHWKQMARFHNPLKNGQLDEQEIEVRLDPLLGHQSILNPGLAEKTSILFPPTDTAYLEQRAAETRAQCFLCDGKWRQTTPRYAEQIVPEGRLVKGEAVLFPNLFPLAAYHAVIMLGNQHYRPLHDFPASLLKDAFAVSLEFIRRCREVDPCVLHFTVNANYLFPAGSSVLHPHLQLIGSPFPGTMERLLLEKSRAYAERTGSCYWMDLAATEKRLQSRWLGQIAGSRWFTAYSPTGVNEVNAVTPQASNFLEWGDAELTGMAEGIARTLKGYHTLGFSTFNFSCFSAPVDIGNADFRCFLRLINRQNAVPHYRADDYYFQKLLGNEIIIYPPENLALLIKDHF